MSFASSAAWIVGGTLVGTQLYRADQARKSAHQQTDALNAAKAADDAQKLKAEEGANAAIVANKMRKRRAAGLLPIDQLGGSSTVLGSAADQRSTIGTPAPRATLGGI